MVLPRAMKAVSLSLIESGSGQAVLGRQRKVPGCDPRCPCNDELEARLDRETRRGRSGTAIRCHGCHSELTCESRCEQQADVHQAAEGHEDPARWQNDHCDRADRSQHALRPVLGPRRCVWRVAVCGISAILLGIPRIHCRRVDRDRTCLRRGLGSQQLGVRRSLVGRRSKLA